MTEEEEDLELYLALVNNQAARVHQLLRRGLQLHNILPNDVIPGTTSLHLSACLGHLDCVKVNVELGFDVNVQEERGWTPLMYAVAGNHSDVVEYLLIHKEIDIHVVDEKQQGLLCIAALTDRSPESTRIVQCLLNSGSEVNSQDMDGVTPLMRAIENQNIEMVKLLVKHDADLAIKTEKGRSAMHYAAATCSRQIIDVLIKNSGECNAVDYSKQTPLIVAVQQRKPPISIYQTIKLLLQYGCDVNTQDENGDSALLHAIYNSSCIKCPHIELLIAAGANINVYNNQGLSALWQAVYDGIHYPDRLEIIQVLLEANCQLNTPCRGKLLFTMGYISVFCYETPRTPLEVAMDSGFYAAAKRLIMAGCQIKEEVYADLQVMQSRYAADELNWFHHVLAAPPALQQFCRMFLREMFGRKVKNQVKELPLPHKLKDYLLLKDLKEFTD